MSCSVKISEVCRKDWEINQAVGSKDDSGDIRQVLGLSKIQMTGSKIGFFLPQISYIVSR